MLQALDAFAESAGLNKTLLRFAVSIYSSVPLAIVLRYLPNAFTKHLYSCLSGVGFMYVVFGVDTFTRLLPVVIICWMFMLVSRKYCHVITWAFAMPFLIWCHVNTSSGIMYKEGGMDFTVPLMVVTLKVIACAQSYRDGITPKKQLLPYHVEKSLEQRPGLLEYLGYMFCVGNLLAGPTFEFKDYQQFSQGTGPWAKPVRGGLWEALRGTLLGLASMVIYLVLGPRASTDLLREDWYLQASWLTRVATMWWVSTIARSKYYFGFKVAEAAHVASGLGFNGYSPEGKPRWDRAPMVDPVKLETVTSAACIPLHWNIATGLWLRHYVYERIVPVGSRPTFSTLLITQFVSGIWHGLYPGYILFFVSTSIFVHSARVLFKVQQLVPAGLPQKAFTFLLWLHTISTLNYLAVPFQILTWEESVDAWKSVGFFFHLVLLAISVLGGAVRIPSSKAAREVLKPAGEYKAE